MRRLVVIALLSASAALAALTQITDTIFRADGSLAAGTIGISWQAFTNASGSRIPAGNIKALQITAGVFSVDLEPNIGATPQGTSYSVVYSISGSPVQTYRWYVPVSASPVGRNVVEFPVPGLISASAVVSPTQLIGTGATLGSCIVWNGSYAVWSASCGGAGAFPSFGQISSGTNNAATMTVGTGGSLTYSGSGSVNANKVIGTAITALSGSGGKLLQTLGTLTSGHVLSVDGSGNAVDGTAVAANLLVNTGSYSNPAWITALAATKLTGTVGCGIMPSLYGDATTVLNSCATTVTTTGGVPFAASATTNALNAANISSGTLPAARLPAINLASGGAGGVTGNLPVTNLGSGTGASASTAWFGDGTWKSISAGGTVTHTSGPLAAGNLLLGNSLDDLTILGSLGSSTTVLHGNTGGSPIWAAVDLTADVTGTLPAANGGLGTTSIVFSGPSGGAKTFTLPNATTTILTTNAAVSLAQGGTGADLSTIIKGGVISGTGSGTVGITAVGTDGQILSADAASTGGVKWVASGAAGTVTSIVFSAPLSGGTITSSGTVGCATCVTSGAALTANRILIGNGGQAGAVLGSLGTSTTLLHGNSGGAPTWSAVDLAADVTGILPTANGGLGTAYLAFTGPASTLKTFTLPNVSTTILTTYAAVTLAQGGTGADLSTIAKGGLVSGTGSGTVGISTVGTDGQVLSADAASTGGIKWVAAAGVGTVTSITFSSPLSGGVITSSGTVACATCVTSAAALTASRIVLGGGSQASAVLGSLGTTTTVLHGNAAGAPSFGAVDLTADVTGINPLANGGTGTTTGSITGTGALGFTAGGTNQDLTLTPSGTGSVRVVASDNASAFTVGNNAFNAFIQAHSSSSYQGFIAAKTDALNTTRAWGWERRADTAWGTSDGGFILYGEYWNATAFDHYVAPIMFNPNGDIILAGSTRSGVVNGKVGIGTPSPLAKLHVKSGSAGVTSAWAGTKLLLESDDTSATYYEVASAGWGGLAIGANGTQNVGGLVSSGIAGQALILYANSSRPIHFYTATGGPGTATPKVEISATGEVTLFPSSTGAGNTAQFRFNELAANGTEYVGFKAPDAITTSAIWTLPSADGTANYCLRTDGSGILSFVACYYSGGTDVAVADGGTGTSTGSITGTGALTFAAGGSDQNVTLTPSGSGYTILNGRVGIGSTPLNSLEVGDALLGTIVAKVIAVSSNSSNSVITLGQSSTVRGRFAWVYNATEASAYSVLGNASGYALHLQDLGGDLVFGGGASVYPLKFREASGNGTEYVGFKAPDAITTSAIWTLPTTDGTANAHLRTDGAGVLSWGASDGVVNVKDYGATGDGTHDDTPHIQAAIDSCSAGQCKIFLPAGTYKTMMPLTVVAGQDGIEFGGAGRDATVIKAYNATNDCATIPTHSDGDVIRLGAVAWTAIRNLSIQRATLSGANACSYGINLAGDYTVGNNCNGAWTTTIDNVYIVQVPNSIRVWKSDVTLIKDSRLQVSPEATPGLVPATSVNILVDGPTATACPGSGGFGSQGVTLENVVMDNGQSDTDHGTAAVRLLSGSGIYFKGIEAARNAVGVLIDPPADKIVQHVTCAGNNMADANVHFGWKIYPAGKVENIRCQGVWMNTTGSSGVGGATDPTTGDGLWIGASGAGTVDGVQLIGAQMGYNTRNGVYVTGGGAVNNVDCLDCLIVGNSRGSMATDLIGTSWKVGADTGRWSVKNSKIGTAYGTYFTSVTNHGIWVEAGTSDNYEIANNTFNQQKYLCPAGVNTASPAPYIVTRTGSGGNCFPWHAGMVGSRVQISGTTYEVTAYTSPTSITVGADPGSHTGLDFVYDPNILDLGTGVQKSIHDNFISDTAMLGPTVEASATTTLPPWGGDRFFVSGTTAIQTLAPAWNNRTVKLIFTNGSPGGVTTGDNIAKAVSAAQWAVVDCTYEASSLKWYCK